MHRVICPHTTKMEQLRESICLQWTLVLPFSVKLTCLLTYQDYAYSTAVYLINRLPSSINFHVPYTLLFKLQLDYAFLNVFGCACFPLLRPYNTHKLDFRSHKCIFLRHSTYHKDYRCLSPSGKLYISKDVRFNALRFPYYDLFSEPTLSQSSPREASLSSLDFHPLPFPLHFHLFVIVTHFLLMIICLLLFPILLPVMCLSLVMSLSNLSLSPHKFLPLNQFHLLVVFLPLNLSLSLRPPLHVLNIVCLSLLWLFLLPKSLSTITECRLESSLTSLNLDLSQDCYSLKLLKQVITFLIFSCN